MQTITTKVNISEDRKLIIQLPANIPPGEYEVVLVLNNSSPQPSVQALITEAQALVRQFVPAERSFAVELIEERRGEIFDYFQAAQVEEKNGELNFSSNLDELKRLIEE